MQATFFNATSKDILGTKVIDAVPREGAVFSATFIRFSESVLRWKVVHVGYNFDADPGEQILIGVDWA